MGQKSTVVIIDRVLVDSKVRSLADLADKPKLFCKVFKEIFNLMTETLLSDTEDKIPTPTLEVIRDDLFKVTKELRQYPKIPNEQLQYPDHRIDLRYGLNDLNKIVNAARAEIIEAIGFEIIFSKDRTKGIQNCRDELDKASDMIEEFEARRI